MGCYGLLYPGYQRSVGVSAAIISDHNNEVGELEKLSQLLGKLSQMLGKSSQMLKLSQMLGKLSSAVRETALFGIMGDLLRAPFHCAVMFEGLPSIGPRDA